MQLKEALGYLPDDGLQHYPIFDEAHRDALNQKILDRFWNREIGQETPSMFRLALRRKMNEIMPYYNQLYKSEQLKFDPFKTIGIKNVSNNSVETSATGESTTESDSNAKSRAVASTFPQTQLNGSGDYATNAQDNISDTNATGKGSEESSSKQDGTGDSETSGFSGNQTNMLMLYRESFLNIDLEIIEQLNNANLFMLVWDNGDEYSERSAYNGFGYPLPY
jgi:hypothetical protein